MKLGYMRAMTTDVSSLLERVIRRTDLVAPDGKSGTRLERVTLDDGTALVVKVVSPAWDWLVRATGDTGRAVLLFQSGIMERIPEVIEHGVVAVEAEQGSWTIVMTDLSHALIPEGPTVARRDSRRVLAATADLHDEFRGERIQGLCALDDRYRFLAPATAAREADGTEAVPKLIGRGWEIFFAAVAQDVAAAVAAILDDPSGLTRQFRSEAMTLIHGDLKLGNLGLLEDRVVMLDWGDRAGIAPPEVEFAWYLAINASRIEATREELIQDWLEVCGDRRDERALALALVGGLAQLGWNKALDALDHPDPEVRARESADLDWWVSAARRGLDIWSPV
jgi:hypothetical protein